MSLGIHPYINGLFYVLVQLFHSALSAHTCDVIGVKEGLPLPYRGQDVKVLPSREELEAVPEGPSR
jgi:hypothetical protein